MFFKTKKNFIMIMFTVSFFSMKFSFGEKAKDNYVNEAPFNWTLEQWTEHSFALPEFRAQILGSEKGNLFFHQNRIQEIDLSKFKWILQGVKNINEERQTPEQKKEEEMSYILQLKVEDGDRIASCGDIHGSLHALIRFLRMLKKEQVLKNDLTLEDKCKVIFLGDYVDRGRYSVEVSYLVMLLKMKNKDSVFLPRGNHDGDSDINNKNGSFREFKEKFDIEPGEGVESVIKEIGSALNEYAICIEKNTEGVTDRLWFSHGLPFDANPDTEDTTGAIMLEKIKGYIKDGILEKKSYLYHKISGFSASSLANYYIKTKLNFLPTADGILNVLKVDPYNIRALFKGHEHGARVLNFVDRAAEKPFQIIKPYSIDYKTAKYKKINDYLNSGNYLNIFVLSNGSGGLGSGQPGEGGVIIKIDGPYDNWEMKILDLTDKNDKNYDAIKSKYELCSFVKIDEGAPCGYSWSEPVKQESEEAKPKKVEAGLVETPLASGLGRLKDNLASLIKLDALKLKLGSLQQALVK